MTSLNCSACAGRYDDLSVVFAVLLGFIAGHLVTSTFLLCKFRGPPGSTPVSFPVMSR